MSAACWSVRDLLRANPDLQPAARAVALALATFADEHGDAWPTVETLAAVTGLHAGSIRRALGPLERAGLVLVDRSPGRSSNRYRLPVQPAHQARVEYPQPAHQARVEPAHQARVEPPTRAPCAPTRAPGALNPRTMRARSRQETDKKRARARDAPVQSPLLVVLEDGADVARPPAMTAEGKPPTPWHLAGMTRDEWVRSVVAEA